VDNPASHFGLEHPEDKRAARVNDGCPGWLQTVSAIERKKE
jgi:hypothetical protein